MKICRQIDSCLERLKIPTGTLDAVLDTDTYNEIDDQFALAYALLSVDRLNIQAVYAAPFSNERASTPGEGMEKSYEEILRIMSLMGTKPQGFVFKGSSRYLNDSETPVKSEAALDLVQRAMSAKSPLYVIAIAAITNIAAAILIEPQIIDKIVVVWLGGHSLYWPHTDEFNLKQDLTASRLLFDCGVPIVQVPCMPVASHMTTSVQELGYYLHGKNALGTYLVDIFSNYLEQRRCLTKEIWDLAAVAALIEPTWVHCDFVHSPILTDQITWSKDVGRHLIQSAQFIDRDSVFRDMYAKVESFANYKK